MKLSVIIPALNEADFLPTTIRMLRENSVSDICREIIVSDSGSEDGTPEIALLSWAQRLSNVKTGFRDGPRR